MAVGGKSEFILKRFEGGVAGYATDFLGCRQTEVLKVNKAYLWPRSKVWIRAYEASIQTAATKVTNMLYLVCSLLGRQLKKIKLFI